MKKYIYPLLLCFLPLFSNNIEKMTLEEKIGQLLITYVEGEEFNQEAKYFLEEIKPGGIILYGFVNGLTNPKKIKYLCEKSQQLSLATTGLPLIISVDQEGGKVSHLKKEFTHFPGNSFLGDKDPLFTKDVYTAIGKELRTVGINMNLAPVIDINSNPANPVIGSRSFGANPQIVTSLGEMAIEGLQDAGVMPCLKHFPGHGDTREDSHLSLPIVMKTKKEIDQMELLPFLKLSSLSPSVMTAHILFPAIDPDNCATTSKYFIQEVLRKECQFDGVIITDSLTMKGVLQLHGSIEKAAIAAFNAGCDILLIGNDTRQMLEEGITHFEIVKRVQQSLIKAVKRGIISEKKVDESLSRIISLKNRLQINPGGNLSKLREEHHSLISEIRE